MFRHTFLTVLFLTMIALVAGIYLTSLKNLSENYVGTPWDVKLLPSGKTSVFGLVLGESKLIEAERKFKAIAEVTLFSNDGGEHSVEGFFTDVNTAGFKAKFVVKIQLTQEEMQQMFDRGVRISTLGSGTRKIALSGEDKEHVRHSPIASITYLPSIHLDDEQIQNRFGEPARKLNDSQSDAVHWLYPEKGVDIAISESRKEVIQYVVPEKFDMLVAPLTSTQE